MKYLNSIYAIFLMICSTKIFRPKKEFRKKRVAIIGATDSAFEQQDGKRIDQFDIVIWLNKAPHYWSAEKAEFIGSKCTFLFHSYYENQYSGGGPVDWKLYDKLGIEKVINPNFSFKGFTTHLNYYKRNLRFRNTYILSKKSYKQIVNRMDGYLPTVGYVALNTVLNSECEEVYITGFTFFKTPYAKDYRKELQDPVKNREHIKKQGIHSPDLEFQNLKYDLMNTSCKKVHLDPKLQHLIKSNEFV